MWNLYVTLCHLKILTAAFGKDLDEQFLLVEIAFNKKLEKESEALKEYLLNCSKGRLLSGFEELVSTGYSAVLASDYVFRHLFIPMEQRLSTEFEDPKLCACFVNLAAKTKYKDLSRFSEQIMKNISEGVKSIWFKKDLNVEGLVVLSLTLEAMGHDSQQNAVTLYGEVYVSKLLKERDFLFWIQPPNKASLRNLVKIFQSFVRVGLGSLEVFDDFLRLFREEKVLVNLGMIELIIKYLPSLGIKTKALANQVTNLPKINSISGPHKNVNTPAAQLRKIKGTLEDAWRTLDIYLSKSVKYLEIEKIPAI
jgi:hypothetical protein